VSVQIFCDEGKSKGFLLAAASISCSDVDRLRGEIAGLLLRRQVRIHFRREQASRQRMILDSLIAAGGICTVVYDATRYGSQKAGRDAAIERMADHAAIVGASRIVLESDDSAVARDQAIIKRQLKRAGIDGTTGIDHCRASEVPLLAVPDVVAWCYAKGGTWRQRAEPLISDVVTLLCATDVRSPAHRPSDRLPGSTSRGCCRARFHRHRK
jgi:hypothetical protein